MILYLCISQFSYLYLFFNLKNNQILLTLISCFLKSDEKISILGRVYFKADVASIRVYLFSCSSGFNKLNTASYVSSNSITFTDFLLKFVIMQEVFDTKNQDRHLDLYVFTRTLQQVQNFRWKTNHHDVSHCPKGGRRLVLDFDIHAIFMQQTVTSALRICTENMT